jgi:hypothetical protein
MICACVHDARESGSIHIVLHQCGRRECLHEGEQAEKYLPQSGRPSFLDNRKATAPNACSLEPLRPQLWSGARRIAGLCYMLLLAVLRKL